MGQKKVMEVKVVFRFDHMDPTLTIQTFVDALKEAGATDAEATNTVLRKAE